uniref:Uncharacterized protein n=1 Tax=Trichobilharzia regenti TaxID=157069 RepID=A0AA85JRX9_TRIRE|nr:unnamed protein product [Trichobilharzia regenti]CAH8823646.1 unnamed protein product [Trichobilharzia regenti]
MKSDKDNFKRISTTKLDNMLAMDIPNRHQWLLSLHVVNLCAPLHACVSSSSLLTRTIHSNETHLQVKHNHSTSNSAEECTNPIDVEQAVAASINNHAPEFIPH